VEHLGPGGTPTETTPIEVTYVTTAVALHASSATADNAPAASLTVSPSSGQAPLSVTADASVSTDPDATPIASYTFDFGDGSATVGPQTGATATHTYQSPGTYTVTVTVADTGGLSSTATAQARADAPTVNLVGNPGFETNTSGWTVTGQGVSLSRVAGGHSGSWAARIFNGGGSTVTATLDDSPNWVATTQSGTYTVSAWVRGDTAGERLTLRVQELRGSRRAGSTSTQVTLSTSWRFVTLTYAPASPGGSTLDLNLFVKQMNAQTGFYVDDVTVTRS
jgi:hypothetical protein